MKYEKGMKQPELAAAIPNALQEYSVNGEAWRCHRFDLLALEFGLTSPKELELFHEIAIRRARGWMMVRRLFGLAPMVPPANAELDDLRLWERGELLSALGLTKGQLQEELDAVRGAFGRHGDTETGRRGDGETGSLRPDAPAPRHADTFHFAQEDLLARHGFSMRFSTREEGAWFAQRVKDYELILKEKFATVLARNALMTELRIRQLDDLLNDAEKCKPGLTEWKNVLKLRSDLDRSYQDALTQLKVICPWAGAVAGKHSFQGVLSDVTQAIQEFAGKGDTRLVDGIFTMTEILVECRRSTQMPEPRYRAGLVVFLNAAKAGLWDPNWNPGRAGQAYMTPGQLKKLDGAWKAALVAAGDEEGEAAPDLEVEGAAGEYPLIEEVKA